MRWNRNSIEFNLLIILILAAICITVLPVIRENEPCFHPARYQNRILIIDAGHGGEDGGAISVTGTSESHINLAIALKLESLCGLFGMDTRMTRRDDVSLKDPDAATLAQKKRTDLQNRVALINSTENAVLISVHQNYFEGNNKGAQVFFAPTANSEAWALHCQQIMVDSLDPSNHRKAKPISKDIYLMSHITCPGILVECGFLSHPEEAKKLEDDQYQTKIALSIMDAYLTCTF